MMRWLWTTAAVLVAAVPARYAWEAARKAEERKIERKAADAAAEAFVRGVEDARQAQRDYAYRQLIKQQREELDRLRDRKQGEGMELLLEMMERHRKEREALGH